MLWKNMLFPVPSVEIASSGCSVSEDYGIDEHMLKSQEVTIVFFV